MRYDLTNCLEHARQQMGDDDFAMWSSALRRELILWLRASTSRFSEVDDLRLELVVGSALTAVGIIEVS
jgi:hypothetical protein